MHVGDVGSLQPLLSWQHDRPLDPERQQLPWGSPMAGKPHGRPLNLEQLPSPREQLGPAGHKSLMTQAERGRRLLQAVGEGEGEEQAGGGSETLSLPSTPKPHPLPPSPGWRLCILWANFS